jgi:purine-nucleoside phosphorylase
MPMKRFEQKSNLLDLLRESVAEIRKHTSMTPEVGIILGTGLGNLVSKVKKEVELPYKSIPNFPVSTVQSHAGNLLFGTLGAKKVVVMEGRFHFYEGYDVQDVVFPVRVMKELGAKILVVSNAAGAMNLNYRKGEIVVIEDHINFMGVNPLIGPNDERIGPRFPDMSQPYSARLAGLVEEAARELKQSIRRGVYVGVSGPNLETRAEYRMLRAWGADLVGMSTVPEVITAVHMGMEVLGVSIATDLCDPDHLEPCDIKEIIKTANEAGPKLDKLLESAIQKF